jgi:hypothetical protein
MSTITIMKPVAPLGMSSMFKTTVCSVPAQPHVEMVTLAGSSSTLTKATGFPNFVSLASAKYTLYAFTNVSSMVLSSWLGPNENVPVNRPSSKSSSTGSAAILQTLHNTRGWCVETSGARLRTPLPAGQARSKAVVETQGLLATFALQ